MRPTSPRLASWFAACLAVLSGLVLAFPSSMRTAAIGFLRVGLCTTSSPNADSARWLAVGRYTAFAIATLTAIGALLAMWWGSASAHLGMAGFLPVSDALGYYGCALAISASDGVPAAGTISDWCARRILYPAMLNSLLGLTGWQPSVALALQALTIGLSSGFLLLALQRTFGWITAVLTTIAVLTSPASLPSGIS